MDPKMKEMLENMLNTSEEERIELARKRTQEMIKLPKEQLAKQIEGTIHAFNSLNDEDMKTLVRASVIAVDELPPEVKSTIYSARALAGLSVPEGMNYRILATGAKETLNISEESYEFFRTEFKKACDAYNIPFPEFLKTAEVTSVL
ncbi:MAG: hypothetical protein ACFFDB_10090 [Promethearchaeota archaeon]